MRKYISIILAAAVVTSLSGCAASDNILSDIAPASGGVTAGDSGSGGASGDGGTSGGASAGGSVSGSVTGSSGGDALNGAYTPTDIGGSGSSGAERTHAATGIFDAIADAIGFGGADEPAAGASTAADSAGDYSYSDVGGTGISSVSAEYAEYDGAYDGAYDIDAPMTGYGSVMESSAAGVVDDFFAEPSAADEDCIVECPEFPGDEDWVEIPPQAGLLTGGEWNDNDHWNDWVSLYQSREDWSGYKEQWQISFDSRCEVTVTSGGAPVEGARVSCPDVGSAVTDNSGRAYLFFDKAALAQGAGYEITAEYGGISASVPADLSGNKTAEIELEGAEKRPSKKLDLMIMCDTTGSMMDELRYLQEELEDVVTRVKKDNANLPIRLSVNFYRDEGDEYIVREFPFTENLDDVVGAIRAQSADGGGDFPEAVHTALNSAINSHDWDEDAVKIMFLVLDAPPHDDSQIVGQVNSLVKQAAEKGIRIIPVASSGIDKSTEYLLRTMAFVTGGTYTFLTDDSGIGYGHIEPTIGDYAVEKLNDMMVRIVNRYLADDPEEFAAPAPEPAAGSGQQ